MSLNSRRFGLIVGLLLTMFLVGDAHGRFTARAELGTDHKPLCVAQAPSPRPALDIQQAAELTLFVAAISVDLIRIPPPETALIVVEIGVALVGAVAAGYLP